MRASGQDGSTRFAEDIGYAETPGDRLSASRAQIFPVLASVCEDLL